MKECFVISPIGDPGSDVRIRADQILKHVVRPVCTEKAFEAKRADEIPDPGLISQTIIRKLLTSDLVIADLTGHNPNVFYEVAIRHFVGKPIVQLIDANGVLPFDVFDTRTIKIDHRNMDSVEEARRKLGEYIDSVMSVGTVVTPITMALDTIGITLSTGQSKLSLEQQLLQLTQKVILELEQSRKDRSLLIQNMVSQNIGGRETEHKAPADDGTVTGLWAGNHGKVLLSQNDDFLVGEYQYDSHEWVGEVLGKVLDDTVVFEWSWKDGSMAGIGFWHIHGEEMIGAWFHKSECDLTLDDLLVAPKIIDSLKNQGDREWCLSRIS